MKRGRILAYSIILVILITLISQTLLAEELSTSLLSSEIIFLAHTEPKTNAEIYANISFFPKNTEFQKIEATSIIPESAMKEETASTLQTFQKTDDFSIKLKNLIRISPDLKKIRMQTAQIETNNANEDLEKYLEADDYINSDNEDIINLADEITANETGQYETVFRLASWVKNNIQYNLSTLNEPTTKNAAWILKNKKGVCSELSILLATLIRAEKMPARIVEGIAYTESKETAGSWVPHAWVEAYFPGAGWVPFDPTFAQFGWIDSNHIITRYPDIINEPSIHYEWESEKQTEIIPENPIINVTAREKTPYADQQPQIKINPVTSEISPLSFLPIRIDLKNPNDYYMPLTLYLKKSPESREKIKPILLKPYEEKTDFFIINIPNINDVATTIEIADSFGNTYSSHVEISDKYKQIRKANAEYIMNKTLRENALNNFKEINLDCMLEKNSQKLNEKISIICTIENNGIDPIDNINLCLGTSCEKINLDRKVTTTIEFTLKNATDEIAITADKDNKMQTRFVKINLAENQPLKINAFECPRVIQKDENSTITLSLEASQRVKDAHLNIEGLEIIDLKPFSGIQQVIVPVKGDYFYDKEGYIFAYVLYQDEDNQYYEAYDSCLIKVTNLDWKDKIYIYLSKLLNMLPSY